MNREEAVFPFAAVLGQEQVKLALLLNAVSHQVGGVLIRGKRGTAKSTLARGLAQLLPEIEVVTDCPFSCDPSDIEALCGYCAGRLALEGSLPSSRTRMKVVTLPLNATEEMVVGTLDVERALRLGEKGFEPGILARANRSILYVDEVNLLEDHIVDILLDSAAMGVNVVEREGISFRHSARFILVGTMNPEEGDLRPQLEDRFGLCAEVDNETPAAVRSEILKRNLEFGRNPLEFESRWHAEQEGLRRSLIEARARYPEVEIPDPVVDFVALTVHRAGADGHRADIAMLHAARALAALEGAASVTVEHVEKVAPMSLVHRLGSGPPGLESRRVDVASLTMDLRREQGENANGGDSAEEGEQSAADPGACQLQQQPGEPFEPAGRPSLPPGEAPAPGRRDRASTSERGRYYRSAPPDPKARLKRSDIAIDATIRASASRGTGADGVPAVSEEDIRVKVRRKKCGASILFVVDASASMGAEKRLDASREAAMSLLVEAYQKRDRVGMVVFKDSSAQLVMSPTSSHALACRLLAGLSPGGSTPLSAGLALGHRVLKRELSRNPAPSAFLVLISDGGGNVTLGYANPMSEALAIAEAIREQGINSIVFDCAPRSGAALAGRPTAAKKISDALGAAYYPVTNITVGKIVETVTRTACGGVSSRAV